MANKKSQEQRARSPSPPTWSPITPSVSNSNHYESMEDTPTDLPPNVPISESSNTDVIALRAALSVLQMQRVHSAKNLQTLDRQRELALAHPEDFRQGLIDGSIRSEQEADMVFEEEDTFDKDEDKKAQEPSPPTPLRDFGRIPAALNIVRCPPVNWSKYHIAGEVLDQLHEQQRRKPDDGLISMSLPSRPHTIAAPYSPWHDKLVEMPKPKTPTANP